MTAVPLVSDTDPVLRDAAGVCVALSGGLDSTVLLHVFAQSPAVRERGLRALHVHHGLHADANAWAAQCRSLCDGLGVTLDVARVEVARDSGEGLEGAARRARHAAFAAALRPGEVLALAHHRNDQAETLLLRALRGSGVDGLAAMARVRPCGAGRLWRPLLDVPRDALLAHARAHALDWIDDPSNADESLDRNFLRRRVLPLLRERWPQADASFARVAMLADEAAALLADEDARALAASRTLDPQVLARDALHALPAARRARVLRAWIDALGLPPLPAAGIAAIETQLLDARADAEARFTWHGAAVQAWRDLLHAGREHAPLPADWRVDWDGRAPLALPGGGTLALEGANGFDAPLLAHARIGGERLTLPGRRHSHALKHVLQDLGVPPWERAQLPLLSDADGRVLAAGDLAYAAGFDTWLRARNARLAWTPPP